MISNSCALCVCACLPFLLSYVSDFDVSEWFLTERPDLIEQHAVAVYITGC